MVATKEEKQVADDLMARGREDYSWFMTHCLDVNPKHLWCKMREINDSIRDNKKTVIGAGHGVSKTYTMARVALTFLYCHPPATVVITGPSWHQVKDEMWREIRASHGNSKVYLGGHVTTVGVDMQPLSKRKWFMFGISTKPDTVTQEATRLQGHHNTHFLKIIDEAAGVHPAIWKVMEHIGSKSHDRTVAIGNPTAAKGEFAEAIKDPAWNYINVSVLDTPNYINDSEEIPEVYGREYERDIRLKYGEDSDEYRVRVKGLLSQKAALGSYYGDKIAELRKKPGRIGVVLHDPSYAVHIVRDAGFTSAFWFFQVIGSNVRFIYYYEDSGPGVEEYVRRFEIIRKENNWHWGQDFVPFDFSSNAHRVVTGATAYEELQSLGLSPTKLPLEKNVLEGIKRTQRFLNSCWFDEAGCKKGIPRLEAYHEGINYAMSTEKQTVYTGAPAKDGPEHAADAMRYASKAAPLIGQGSSMTVEKARASWENFRRH